MMYRAPLDANESTSGAFHLNDVETFGCFSFFAPGTMLKK